MTSTRSDVQPDREVFQVALAPKRARFRREPFMKINRLFFGTVLDAYNPEIADRRRFAIIESTGRR
jgi:hypothetical protein